MTLARTRIWPVLGILAFFQSLPSFAENRADVVYDVQIKPYQSANLIKGLRWKSEKTRVRVTRSAGVTRYLLHLEGDYDRPDWSLVVNRTIVTRDARGAFVADVPILPDMTEVQCLSVSPLGEVERETLIVNNTSYRPRDPEIPGPSSERRLRIVPGLGLTSLRQTGEGNPDYTSLALTTRISAFYFVRPPTWDVGGSLYYTALQLTRSREVDVRYLGLNFRVGYNFPHQGGHWAFGLYGGWYYATMFVTPYGTDPTGAPLRVFGYDSVSGPQIYPSVKYKFDSNAAVSAYLKFSPISKSLSLLTLSNREFALGASFIRALARGHSHGLSFDYSRINLVFGNIEVGTQTMTLGYFYGF